MTYEGTIEKESIGQFAERAYLNYAMSVILDRALPHIADGLKPVQRRIVYAMSELGLKSTAKFKKSARTVGDVLGKYHPHGDMACYEAMVLMAQPFSYKYPLIDGQGNWGSSDDPKSFAAMRYTESKLSSYANALLSELEQGTVDWKANFDGSLKEPELLPARLPNILLNGTSGIAVGMATDIPPHNLSEVINACVALLENPDLSIENLCEYILAPDYPTEAEIITPREELLKLYQTGIGSIRMRAVYAQEKENIIITHLPHQVSGAKILEQIAEQMRQKKLPMVEDLRDESDHENPMRLVIIPRSNRVDTHALMHHLFATTDLEKTYRVNLNMIGLNNKPQVKNLKIILSEWLVFRQNTVTKRLKYRLNQVLARLHILQGLLIAYLNLDEIIKIIREEDHPKQILMQKFKLSQEQAEAILEIKLRQLAKLEEIKIRSESEELSKEQKKLETILNSPSKLKMLIREELLEDSKRYAGKRKSPIIQRSEAQAIREEDILPSEPVTVILSTKGWVRAAKGHDIEAENLAYKSGDGYLMSAKGKSQEYAVFLDSTGRAYAMLASKLPSARGQGEPLTTHTQPPPNAEFKAVIMANVEDYFLIASDLGYGFLIKFNELISKNKAGKNILTLPLLSQILMPIKINNIENDLIAVATQQGRMLIFPVKQLPVLSKGKGNKLIAISQEDFKMRGDCITAITRLSKEDSLQLSTGKANLILKPQDLSHYLADRAKRGHKLPRGCVPVSRMMIA